MLWVPITLMVGCVSGLAVAATIVLSLISIYLPNQATSNLCRISFAPMISQATGAGPKAVRAADFNNDNFLDLAVANFNGNTTTILLGYGNGSFIQHTNLSNGLGAGTNGIAIGDVNNDHLLDIVVANRKASNVGVFLGQGDGNFSSQIITPTGYNSTPVELALQDLNNDTVLDLVVTDHENDKLHILIGTGNGSFTEKLLLSTGNKSGPYFLVINDFNNDYRFDIAVGNGETNTLGIFFGDGTGNFSEQTTYNVEAGSYALVVGNFNKDGILDIATANYDNNSTTILFGTGNGTFIKYKTLTTGSGSLPYAIDNTDFNHDNIQDLITANSGTDNIGIMLGNGNGNFLEQKIYSTGSGSGPRDVIVADVNGDNRMDFISANYDQDTIGIFLSTCS